MNAVLILQPTLQGSTPLGVLLAVPSSFQVTYFGQDDRSAGCAAPGVAGGGVLSGVNC